MENSAKKSYCREKDKRLWRDMQKIWYEEDILKSNILQRDFWDYRFDENKEWNVGDKVGDYEQSPLSQIFLAKILSSYIGDCNFYINRYYTLINNNKTNEKYKILFDVMNNPNYNIKKKYAYHKIGNFTFVPGKTLNRSLQFVHRDCNERWDEMLKYMRSNWSEINNLPIDGFKDYIKASCQHIYYQDVYNVIKEYNIEKCDICELWNEINNIVDNIEVGADFVKLDSKEIIEKIIYIRGRILVYRFEEAIKNNKQLF